MRSGRRVALAIRQWHPNRQSGIDGEIEIPSPVEVGPAAGDVHLRRFLISKHEGQGDHGYWQLWVKHVGSVVCILCGAMTNLAGL